MGETTECGRCGEEGVETPCPRCGNDKTRDTACRNCGRAAERPWLSCHQCRYVSRPHRGKSNQARNGYDGQETF